jgi:outer membrane protein assembly factor BamD (BamD/ComL family)
VPHDKTPAPTPTAPSVAPLTLEEETSALEKVRDELRSGKPGTALGALDDYERAARNKHLSAEATLLKIQALAASGRASAASVLAERFVNAYPHSPLVDRARRYLVATADGGSEPSEDPGR